MKYYDIKEVIEKYPEATVIYSVGVRGSGKSFSCKCECIENWLNTGMQFILMGRQKEDITCDIIVSFFDDVIGLYQESIQKKFGVNKPVYVVAKNAKSPVIYIATAGEKRQDDILGVMGYAWSVKYGERFKRGVWHDKVNRILFDEFITNSGYYHGTSEPYYFEKFIGSLARSTNSGLKVYMCGNPDYNIEQTPYLTKYNIDYSKLEPNSITTYDTLRPDGSIKKNNVIFVKVNSHKDQKSYLNLDTVGLFSTTETNMAVTGEVAHNTFNNVTIRSFKDDIEPVVTFKVETAVKRGEFPVCLYATVGLMSAQPILVIHRHDIFDKTTHITSCYEWLDKKAPCVYRMNTTMYPMLTEMINKALYSLQLYGEDDMLVQTFINIYKEGHILPYFE